jgi:hypothetical protein
MTTETPTPEPCLRCGAAVPLTGTPREELFCYTARMNLNPAGTRLETDVNREPRGRLCDACTRAFVGWLKEPRS